MTYEQIQFPGRTYVLARRAINISQVTDSSIYSQAFHQVGAALSAHNLPPSGPATVIYFKWDTSTGTAELGIGFPVSSTPELEGSELEVFTAPAGPAVTSVLHGSYDGLKSAHEGINAYIAEHGLTDANVTIEEYITGTDTTNNPDEYVTAITYLVK